MQSAAENIQRLVEWAHRKGLAEPAPSPVRRVGIIGAGTMGTSIAAALARHGIAVAIADLDPVALQLARGRIDEELRQSGGAPSVPVQTTTELATFRECDLVLETIVENLAAKRKLYAQLADYLDTRTLIASNTSAIPLEQLAKSVPTGHPFFGLHFCHPVRLRPLVEIVRSVRLDAKSLATAIALVQAIDRLPIVVSDGPGFVVNRLLFPYLSAALELLVEGVAPARLEQLATDFGMPFGPLRMIDEMGADTTLHAGWVLANAFPDRIVPSPLLVTMIKAGRLGRKCGRGFYAYSTAGEEAAAVLDDDVGPLIARWSEQRQTLLDQSILDRLFLPMVLEAARLLEEGCCDSVRDIDLAAVFGLSFPREKGGLLWWADSRGTQAIADRLVAFDIARLRPTPLLASLADGNSRFYDLPANSE